MAAIAKKMMRTSKKGRAKTPAQSHRKPGCNVCRRELDAFEMPHLEDVFATRATDGDLKRRVFENPAQLASPRGWISYRNDFVFRCKKCRALWLTQYWEVVTPENEDEEFGDRHWRYLPLSARQLAVIVAVLKSEQKLPHDRFVTKSDISGVPV